MSGARRRPTVPPRRVEDDEDKRAAARAGWADPKSPNYRPDLVRARKRIEDRKRWGHR